MRNRNGGRWFPVLGRILAARPNCRLVSRAVGGLGRVCDDPEFGDLVVECLMRWRREAGLVEF